MKRISRVRTVSVPIGYINLPYNVVRHYAVVFCLLTGRKECNQLVLAVGVKFKDPVGLPNSRH